jgi:hypothetical protein
LAIKNGKVYQSKASSFVVQVQSRDPIRWNTQGAPVEFSRELHAEFARHLGEFRFDNELTGSKDIGADIRGHFFDSAQQAEEKGWTQEEHDWVVSEIDRLCSTQPEFVWEFSRPKVPAPWPTYDQAHHKQIPTLAEQLGLVGESLQYEQQNKNRAEIVERLTELVNAATVATVTDEELTAA